MITLITDKDRIEVTEDNPIYTQLKPLTGRFVAVYLSETPKPEEPKQAPSLRVRIKYNEYISEMKEIFNEKSLVFVILNSHVDRFISQGGYITSGAHVSASPGGISASLKGEFIFIPEEYVERI